MFSSFTVLLVTHNKLYAAYFQLHLISHIMSHTPTHNIMNFQKG